MFKYLLARAKEARAAELEGEGGLEGGFTLIELMVVLLIIAILLAIAIPTFLGVSGSARDRAAQSNATNALTNAIAYYQNGQSFDATAGNTACSQDPGASTCTGATGTYTAMQSSEPAFTWQAGTSTGACTVANAGKCVSIQPLDAASSNDGQGVELAVMSGTGTCWFVANLQANPSTVATTGFETATSGAGAQDSGGSLITTAGTYYAQLPKAGTNCYAGYPQAYTTGAWNWGSSYSNAPTN